MANEYAVNHADLKAVAKAIRDKGKTTEVLTFPVGFISAVEAIKGGEVFAFIVVTYPEGSTCTCTNGTLTLNAPDTSGLCVFRIPEAGTWTVSCSLGDDTDSMDVVISAEGQSEEVSLSYTVPSEYQRIEYIECTGTQYIDTDAQIFGEIEAGIEMGIEYTRLYNYQVPWGNTDDQKNYQLFTNSNGETKFRYRYNESNRIDRILQKHAESNVYTDLIWKKTPTEHIVSGWGGTTIIQNSSVSASTARVCLMRAGDGKAELKLYYVKIYGTSGLVADLYPCYRKADSVAGLWDAEARKFYTNNGTGTFVCGGDVK